MCSLLMRQQQIKWWELHLRRMGQMSRRRPPECRKRWKGVDRGEKLGHFGGVKRTSVWVTLRPAVGKE